MASTAHSAHARTISETVAALLAQDGSGRHRHCARLASPDAAPRDLSDAVHFLSMLHGRHPGVIDHAAQRIAHPGARDWLRRALPAFGTERGYLARLTVAVGPLPSTLGQARSEAAVNAQTHALATLSQSERNGTALGAALALASDWQAVRPVLDAAAIRFGVAPISCDLPDTAAALRVAEAAVESPGIERAIGFGAQQLLLQHRGLWDLLETRAGARSAG